MWPLCFTQKQIMVKNIQACEIKANLISLFAKFLFGFKYFPCMCSQINSMRNSLDNKKILQIYPKD